MMEKDLDDVPNTYSIKIGGFAINVNRNPEKDLHKMYQFEDLMPYYDKEKGLHFIFTQQSSEKVFVPLSNSISRNLYIKDCKDMSEEEYFSTFIKHKSQDVDNLVRKIYAYGFEKPSPVQTITTPEIIKGSDAIVQFKSGTGKTFAFLVGTLWSFDINDSELQFIYVTSSHEVATQIYNQVKSLVPPSTNVSLCIGNKKNNTRSTGAFTKTVGTSTLNMGFKSIKQEREELEKAQIIVCTMGKFYDYLINKKMIPSVKYLKAIVVDEFDAIVTSKMNSKYNNNNNNSNQILTTDKQLEEIISRIPLDAQRIFLSATVNMDAINVASNYFRDEDNNYGVHPFICMLNSDDFTLEGIRQYYVICSSYEEKKVALEDLLGKLPVTQAMMYINKISSAMDYQHFLRNLKNPIETCVFHGELSATERKEIHEKLRDNKVRYLISTDVTARGLDLPGVNVVINIDMPNEQETYIHRVGRSGRYGKKGLAISFIMRNESIDEMMKVQVINKFSVNNPMEPLMSNDLKYIDKLF